MTTPPTSEQISDIYRTESSRILATLIRLLGDYDRAEEAVQDAFSAALDAWPREGIPDNPRAWLVSAGRFRGIDALRRQGRGHELAAEAAREGAPTQDVEESDGGLGEDDQLRLLFTCCHPDIPTDARIALALRDICGLTTEQIARSYLVSADAMKRRISRAKALIRDRQIPYEIPSREQLTDRLGAVLHVIYLVYNEGYAASSGDSHLRTDLSSEAVFLARLVVDWVPEPEAAGLLALLLLHESRRSTRVDAQGDPVGLEQQDRTRWDQELISEGVEWLRQAVMSGRLGPYCLQAAIVSVHASASSVADTNWDVIVGYYDMLLRLQASPVVELQRAVAVGFRDGPQEGLRLIDRLIEGGQLASYHAVHAARADFLRRQGDLGQAADAYRAAIELVRQEPERRYLVRQLTEISE